MYCQQAQHTTAAKQHSTTNGTVACVSYNKTKSQNYTPPTVKHYALFYFLLELTFKSINLCMLCTLRNERHQTHRTRLHYPRAAEEAA
jgi:hypothetical protein